MCAPTRDLVKVAAIAAAAYATGGSSLFASAPAATTAATTGTALTTTQLAGTSLAFVPPVGAATTTAGFNLGGIFGTVSNAVQIAAPVLGAAGSIYQGIVNANLLRSKANFVDYSIGMDFQTAALRKIKRERIMRSTLETQRARFGLTGVTLEGTPTDVLEQTAAKYAEDQFIDEFNTSQAIYSKQISASQLRTEAQAAELGGYVRAATTLGSRGFVFPQSQPKPSPSIFTEIPMGQGETF